MILSRSIECRAVDGAGVTDAGALPQVGKNRFWLTLGGVAEVASSASAELDPGCSAGA
jgi:hypothetical protein